MTDSSHLSAGALLRSERTGGRQFVFVCIEDGRRHAVTWGIEERTQGIGKRQPNHRPPSIAFRRAATVVSRPTFVVLPRILWGRYGPQWVFDPQA